MQAGNSARHGLRAGALVLLLALVAGGAWLLFRPAPAPAGWLGYAEADYVRVAPVLAGKLTTRPVRRGDFVTKGQVLFTQDDVAERAARDQAAAELAEARQKLADLRAAGRPPEIDAAAAQLAEATAEAGRARDRYRRSASIAGTGAVAAQDVTGLRNDERAADARLRAARAQLALVQNPSGRTHAIDQAESAVTAADAALRQAQWRLDQRQVRAPVGGAVAETYAEPGETLDAGAPVVSLLPRENLFVRFFVAETALARLRLGQTVRIACDACPNSLTGTISFIATNAAYTPPVIYSPETRADLVYMIEARPGSAGQFWLKPGQPVTVTEPAAARP